MKVLLTIMFVVPLFGSQSDSLVVPSYDCRACHAPTGWVILDLSGFEHDQTAFPLQGAHLAQPCNACHTGQTLAEKHRFKSGNSLCSDCHVDVHQSTLGQACTECHGMGTWQVTRPTFDHEMTTFTLLGAHRFVPCEDCHKERPMIKFDYVQSNCYDCHRLDFEQTTLPPHLSSNFSTDCDECHLNALPSWIATFNHDITLFPLVGIHRTVDCAECHGTGEYDLALDCAACHIEDYETSDLDHLLHGYTADDCEACHSPLGWTPHVYTHDLDLSCLTCHQIDYDETTDPNHLEVEFSTDCETCHLSTRDWTDAQFDHSFPISPNAHQNEDRETCASCHEGYSIPDFSCTLSPCHQGIDDEHRDDGRWETCVVGGVAYTYNPNAADDQQCITCHPNGSQDDCD